MGDPCLSTYLLKGSAALGVNNVRTGMNTKGLQARCNLHQNRNCPKETAGHWESCVRAEKQEEAKRIKK